MTKTELSFDIMQFVSVDESRPQIMQPIHYGGSLYATDGRIALEIPGAGKKITRSKFGESARKIISDAHENFRDPTRPPADFQKTKWADCDCVHPHKGPRLSCHLCDGTGKIESAFGTDCGNHKVFSIYLEKLALLPNVWWDVSTDYGTVIPFTFEGGRGVVMGMRKA